MNESPFAISIPDPAEKSNPSDENSSKKSSEPAKDSLGNTLTKANPDMRLSLPESDAEDFSAMEREDKIDNAVGLSYNIGDLYTSSTEFAKGIALSDRDAFSRSLANKTADIADGEVRTISIYAGRVYIFHADGYMHGNLLRVIESPKLRKERLNEINGDRKTVDIWSQFDQSSRRRGGSNLLGVGDRRRTDANDLVSQRQSRSEQSRNTERARENRKTYTEQEISEILRKLKKLYGIQNSDIRFSLPADAAESAVELESVTAPSIPSIAGEKLTVGQMRKRIANASHYKMYSKKNALIVVKQFEGADLLTQKTQDELLTVLWKRLNEAKVEKKRANRKLRFQKKTELSIFKNRK